MHCAPTENSDVADILVIWYYEIKLCNRLEACVDILPAPQEKNFKLFPSLE